MTREEIARLVREELAKALLQAAEAVIAAANEPRRDRPMRLGGGTGLQQKARAVIERLPDDTERPTIDDAETFALERLKRTRKDAEEMAIELAKLTPEERKIVKKGTTGKRRRELLEQVKRSRG